MADIAIRMARKLAIVASGLLFGQIAIVTLYLSVLIVVPMVKKGYFPINPNTRRTRLLAA